MDYWNDFIFSGNDCCGYGGNGMILKQAAIDKWKNDFKGYINALDIPKDDYKGIMEYIDELPSAQSEWIPCSEPPIENNSYFVWMPFAPKGHHITVAEWCGSYWNIKTPITAWMPIPESWKKYEEK